MAQILFVPLLNIKLYLYRYHDKGFRAFKHDNLSCFFVYK